MPTSLCIKIYIIEVIISIITIVKLLIYGPGCHIHNSFIIILYISLMKALLYPVMKYILFIINLTKSGEYNFYSYCGSLNLYFALHC